MKSHHATIGKSNDWITPQWILEPLGKFDLDPCASEVMPWKTAKISYTEADNGLRKPWPGRIWMNPPFDRRSIGLWMRKMKEHGNGIALIPAATETKHFRETVWGGGEFDTLSQ
jgi:hypothetical protein